MFNTNNLKDITIACVTCGQSFVWDTGTQAYFLSKQLSPPRHCKACLAKRKASLIPDRMVRHD